jgi:outer membrane receptor protein involved in Fe transport
LESRLDSRANLLGVQARRSGEKWSAQTHVWRHDRSEVFDDRSGEVGTGFQWQRDSYATTGVRGHLNWAPVAQMLGSLTLSARHDRFQRMNLLQDSLEDPLERSAIGVTLAAEWWSFSEQFMLSPTLQVDALFNRQIASIQESTTGFGQESETSMVKPNPRIGALWQPLSGVNWVLKSTIGSYFRPPGLDEIFGDRGSIKGNSELVPESGLLVDLGTRIDLEGDWLQASFEQGVFRNHAENKIVFIQNGQRTTVPVNFGEALVQGTETALSLSVVGILDSQTHLTYTESLNQTELVDGAGKQLPRVPVWDLHQSTQIRGSHKMHLGHRYSWTDGNYWDVANVFLAPPRAYHSAFLRFIHEDLSLEISALNLLNETVAVVDRNPFSEEDNTPVLTPLTDFLGYPLPGRSWFVELSWKQS